MMGDACHYVGSVCIRCRDQDGDDRVVVNVVNSEARLLVMLLRAGVMPFIARGVLAMCAMLVMRHVGRFRTPAGPHDSW